MRMEPSTSFSSSSSCSSSRILVDNNIIQEEETLACVSAAPEIPKEPMEFLARAWSLGPLELSKALPPLTPHSKDNDSTLAELNSNNKARDSSPPVMNSFTFGSGLTSQLVLDHILSQSDSSSPPKMTTTPSSLSSSGRLSESSSDPLITAKRTRSLPGSPPRQTFARSFNRVKPPLRGKTVGRWLKDMKEKKKEEGRVQNAQVHAAMSVAGVAAAVAAIAAATAANSGNDGQSQTSMAVASAASLVAAECVEVAESMGADRQQLASVVKSAVNVKTTGDIMTLTAGAATALRGAAILKARTLKDVWNNAYVIPFEKGTNQTTSFSGELAPDCHDSDTRIQDILARGGELLKRTRKGILHLKVVCAYIKHGQVMVKLESKHMGGTYTKKKKSIVFEVCKDIPAWPGRELSKGGEHQRYFGLKTDRGLIQFECKNEKVHQLWTDGISKLLSMAQPLSLTQPRKLT